MPSLFKRTVKQLSNTFFLVIINLNLIHSFKQVHQFFSSCLVYKFYTEFSSHTYTNNTNRYPIQFRVLTEIKLVTNFDEFSNIFYWLHANVVLYQINSLTRAKREYSHSFKFVHLACIEFHNHKSLWSLLQWTILTLNGSKGRGHRVSW